MSSEDIRELDYSNRSLSNFPQEILKYKNTLESLDLTNNDFVNYEEVVGYLSNFINLKNLNIDIQTQEQASLILDNIPSLIILNGQKTKEDDDEEKNNEQQLNNEEQNFEEEEFNQPIINNNNNDNNYNNMQNMNDNYNINNNNNQNYQTEELNIPEVENASLENEINNFNIIVTNIKSFYGKNTNKIKLFCDDFQKFLKKQIDNLNKQVNENVSNYLYALNVYHSKLQIYSFLNKKVIDLLKTIRVGDKFNNILIDSLSKIDKFKNENEKIINNIVNKMNVGLKDNNQNLMNLNQKISENEQMNNEQIKQKDIIIQNLKTQNQNLQKEINFLKKENQKYTKNILDKAKKIIKNEAANSLQTNNNTNTQSNYQTLQEDDNLKSLFSNYNEKIKINPSSIRLIALRNLIDIIYDIYKYKTAYENKGLPKLTLEQYLYSYLKSKYGLKKLVVENAMNILNGIKAYSNDNGEVLFFGLLLRNELDDESINILFKIKETVDNLLRHFCNDFNKFNAIKNNSIFIEENIWIEIANMLFFNNKESCDGFINRINNFLEGKIKSESIINQYGKNILYNDFLNILIKYNVSLRRKYLQNLVNSFREVDENKIGQINSEQFMELIKNLNIYEDENEYNEKIEELYQKIDPNENNKISLSDLVNLLDKEYIIDSRNNTELKALDKIAMN
jgi:hypothetical protein